MEYKGKLFGKVHKSYFPLENTTDDWDLLQKKVSELEDENKKLKEKANSLLYSYCPKCNSSDTLQECLDCGETF